MQGLHSCAAVGDQAPETAGLNLSPVLHDARCPGVGMLVVARPDHGGKKEACDPSYPLSLSPFPQGDDPSLACCGIVVWLREVKH